MAISSINQVSTLRCSQNLERLSQLDHQQDVHLDAFIETKGLFKHDERINFSQAAEKIAAGQKVILRESAETSEDFTVSQYGDSKKGTATFEQTIKSTISSPDDLEQFVSLRSKQEQTSELGKLGVLFASQEGAMNIDSSVITSLHEVRRSGFLGLRHTSNEEISGFEAARIMMNGGQVLVSEVSKHGYIAGPIAGGGWEQHQQESLCEARLSNTEDLLRYRKYGGA